MLMKTSRSRHPAQAVGLSRQPAGESVCEDKFLGNARANAFRRRRTHVAANLLRACEMANYDPS